MRTTVLLIALITMAKFSISQDKPAYLLYNKSGKVVSYADMVNELTKADVVLFGELHNNPIAHWLEFELTKKLHDIKGSKLVLGAEMFESDNQLILDEYLVGFISERKFESEVRLWENYNTDYRPIIKYAKENAIPFTATNIPRRYASVVMNNGFEGLKNLKDPAKSWVAPMPIAYDPELKCYKEMMNMDPNTSHTEGLENMPKAQAIKDATMAHFIANGWSEGNLFLHFNGTYHSDYWQGIAWYLKQAQKSLNIKTIATVSQTEIEQLSDEHKQKADYIICVPESMTRTY